MSGNEPEYYNWLSDSDFNKLKFRTRAHCTRILSGMAKWYGQADEARAAVDALMFVIEQTWDVVRGRDKPIKAPPFFNRYDSSKYNADD